MAFGAGIAGGGFLAINETENGFARNNRDWFDKATARFDNVEGHQADASTFDYSSLGTVAFALVDVDLYRPVANSLRALLPVMEPGGIIVVDDTQLWTGAVLRDFLEADDDWTRVIQLPRTSAYRLEKPFQYKEWGAQTLTRSRSTLPILQAKMRSAIHRRDEIPGMIKARIQGLLGNGKSQ